MMDRLLPSFKRKHDGTLVLSDSLEALAVRRERRETHYKPPETPGTVKNVATSKVERLGGDISDMKHLLGQFQIQFGQYRNETFHWLAENALGYVGYIVASTEKEIGKTKTDNTWLNKMALRKYIYFFKEGVEAVDMKAGKKVVTTPVPSELPDNNDMELAFMAEQIEQDIKANMLTLCIAVLCALMLGVQTQEALFVPCNKTSAPYEGPPLPTFPDQYQTNVEANIVQTNYTINIKEYYDYPNNRFVYESYSRDGTSVRMVGNAEQEEMRLIYPNGTCQVRHINATGSGVFSFVSGPNGTHVRSVKDLMAFGSEYGETYIGETMVRGIQVEHWQTCLKFIRHDGQFTLDFYFTNNTNYVVDGQRVQIPVRAELKGEGVSLRNVSAGSHSFHHFYDFTDFHAGPIQDQQVFEIPPGVYCNGSTISKPVPPVNAQFTAVVEQVVETGDRHMERPMTIYMDQDSHVMRVDVTFPLNPEDVRKFGDKPLIYIKDENTSLLYILDEWELNCTVVKVTDSPGDSHGSFDSSYYFSIFQKDFLYQGKKMFRGFSVESWAYFNQTGSQITELLFHQDEVPSTGPPDGRPFPPNRQNSPNRTTPLKLVGVIEKTLQTDTQQETTVTRHFYGFIPGHPSLEVFDVSSCYSLGNQHRYMAFRVEVNYKSYVMYRKREFSTAVRSAIARGAGVSAVRVTAILVEPNYYNDTETNVYFKLLDNQIYGMSTNNTGPDLAMAKVNLQSAIANGLNFDVQYPAIERNFVVVKETLWETTSPMNTWTSNMKRYSAASMAGLGIGMVVVGAILGLLVSFAIYKKVNTDIPYQVTD